MIASISAKPAPKANSGEAIIGIRTLVCTVDQSTVVPDATAAPTRPPIRAWEDDEGSPKYQVTRFQLIAPSRPAITITRPCDPGGGEITDADRVRDLLAQERAHEVHHRGHGERDPRGQRPRRDRGRDGVRGVVEAVGVVEHQGNHDHRDDDRELHRVRTP